MSFKQEKAAFKPFKWRCRLLLPPVLTALFILASFLLVGLEMLPVFATFALYALLFAVAAFLVHFLARWLTLAVRRPFLEELDLAAYRARLASVKWNKRSALDMMVEAFALGDHQRVLNIAQAVLYKERDPLCRFSILSWLAVSQFVRGDMTCLRLTLGEIEMLVRRNRRVTRAVKKNATLAFLFHFANGQLDLCELDYLGAKSTSKGEYSLLLWEFFLACVYAERGDQARAEQALTLILTRPKTLPVFTAAAQAQLIATDNGEGYVGLSLLLSPEPHKIFVRRPSAGNRLRRRFSLVLIVLALFCVVCTVTSIQDLQAQREFAAKVETQVEQAMPGEDLEYLGSILVEEDGNNLDDLYIFRRANGNLMVGTRYKLVNGDDTVYFDAYSTDFESVKKIERRAHFDHSYRLSYQLYEDKDDIPEDVYDTVKFKHNGKTFYFCVTKVEKRY